VENIFAQTEESLKIWLLKEGEQAFRAGQILDWLYKKKCVDFSLMHNIGTRLQDKLKAFFSTSCLTLKDQQQSSDEQTTKYLFELADGKLVEAVLIRAPSRATVCVSSQVGCPARCAFCASGKEGLIRSLTSCEILEQVYAISKMMQGEDRVTNIVFMGMGEPLENYDNVVKAIEALCDPRRMAFAERKITVSTVGVVEGIYRLAESGLGVNLVLSLHAPNQHIRKKIIPYARKYELEDVLKAMLAYAKETGRDITYEYTLIRGINDDKQNAKDLAALIKDHPATVNLIPYNPVAGLKLQRPEKEAIEMFRAVLTSQGCNVTWRYTKGKDIAAACGQLALKKKEENLITTLGKH
jgi:23S rRNA (adenine2503-C2)-methyltransferase